MYKYLSNLFELEVYIQTYTMHVHNIVKETKAIAFCALIFHFF